MTQEPERGRELAAAQSQVGAEVTPAGETWYDDGDRLAELPDPPPTPSRIRSWPPRPPLPASGPRPRSGPDAA